MKTTTRKRPKKAALPPESVILEALRSKAPKASRAERMKIRDRGNAPDDAGVGQRRNNASVKAYEDVVAQEFFRKLYRTPYQEFLEELHPELRKVVEPAVETVRGWVHARLNTVTNATLSVHRVLKRLEP